MKKTLLAILIVTLGVPLWTTSQAAAANAQPLTDLTCSFALTVTATPGVSLTDTPQQLTGTINIGNALSPATPCSSLFGTPLLGATGTINGSGSQNCLLEGSMSGTMDLTWNNGETSTVTWSEFVLLFIPVISASITSGALEGDTLIPLPIPTGFTGSCLFAPLTALTLTGVGILVGP